MLFYLSFIPIFFVPEKWDLVGKSFSCSVLCTKQSVRVCSPVKLRWRLYAQRKMFLPVQEYFIHFFLEISSHLRNSVAFCWSHENTGSVILFLCFLQLFTQERHWLLISWAAAETIHKSYKRRGWEALCRYLPAFVSSVWCPSAF